MISIVGEFRAFVQEEKPLNLLLLTDVISQHPQNISPAPSTRKVRSSCEKSSNGLPAPLKLILVNTFDLFFQSLAAGVHHSLREAFPNINYGGAGVTSSAGYPVVALLMLRNYVCQQLKMMTICVFVFCVLFFL